MHLGDRDHARRDRRHAGLAAAPELRHQPRGRRRRARSSSRTSALQAPIAELHRRASASATAAPADSMIDPPAGEHALPDRAPARPIPRARSGATSRRASARRRSWPTTACVPGVARRGRDAGRALAATAQRPRRPPTRRRRVATADRDAATPRPPRPSPTATPVATPRRPAAPPPVDRRPRRRRRRARRVQLVERRIGLLFAVFLARCSRSARPRPPGSASSRPASLKRAAVSQQEADIEIPARRGSITDANGIDLAVSEPAMDIAATPYLIKDATKAAAPARAADRRRRGHAAAQAGAAATPASSTSAAASPPTKADQAREARDPRAGVHPALPPRLPARLDGRRSCSAASGTDGQGLGGLEYTLNKQLSGTDGERRLVKDAMGEPIEMRDTKPVQPGHDGPAHARREPAGPGRGGAQRGRQDVAAQGRDRDRDGPQQRRDPRARQLAAGERQRARRGARVRAPRTARSASTTSRARPSRRSPSPPRWRTARSRRTRSSTSRRSCRSPTARSRTPRTTATRR